MKMKGSRILVECLKREKVEVMFYYTGGSVVSLIDDLHEYGEGIACYQPRHEQAGTHSADAYARSTGKVGVMLVTSGPGATNTVTGIATAHMDSVPLIVITGQVPTSKIGTDAFQEADITGITLPLTKANFIVRSADDLALTIKKAFYIACTGRPGPVLVDIPVDVQHQEVVFHYPEKLDLKSYKPVTSGHPGQIKSAVEAINRSRKPLVIAGGGVAFSGSTSLLNRLLDRWNIPVVTTLMGRGVSPGNNDLFYGGIGMHGSLFGNYAVVNSDLILALGVRFSDRIIGKPGTFAPNAKIIHVDIDPAEIGKNIPVDIPIVAPVKNFLETLEKQEITCDTSEWIKELKQYRAQHPLTYKNNGRVKAQYVIETANRLFPGNTIVATDVGQNQMWVAQYFKFSHPRCFISSSGLGTMGFGLPAAIGAKIGNPDREVLMVSGDGGFQMNIQELTTIKKYNLSVKMIVLDNAYLGMVRQWQELLCQKRYSGTTMTDNPDFVRVADAFDIKARKISEPGEVEDAIRELVESEESMLLHVAIDREENVFPMVPAGKSLAQAITTFEPFTKNNGVIK